MTCIHCGENVMTMCYTLRCSPETRSARDVELRLCTDCLRQLCATDTIELVEDDPVVTAN